MQTRCVPFAKDLQILLRLHNQAEAYGKLPSEILGLETPWGAWQLNELTLMVGRRVEKNVNEGKDAWSGFNFQVPRVSENLKSYRSAKGRVTKKVKVKNGIW